MQRTKILSNLGNGGLWIVLALGAVVMLFPIYWIFATAVRPSEELFAPGMHLIPSRFVWSNFATATQRVPFWSWTLNSLMISVLAVVLTVFINLLCGYAFAKLDFVGRNVLFLAIIGTLTIPIQVIIVPVFLIVAEMGLVNTWWGVILPRAAEALGIFMARQFMLSIPNELIEAARLDGASEFRIFRSVVLPNAKPIIAVLIIFNFMWRWNDFALPLVILSDEAKQTLQLGVNLMKGQYYTEWNNVAALALLSLVPILVIFIFFQRYIVQGIASTGLK
ncbi:carbohydrate ABC transporter permease [Labrys wisconsinensis]|uniref:sn-glycerol-3-phosphate transport system permease protein UgpE n=1 Tax=Labrys wisconsinensis TaxID=425677 RepID=A0ABU0J2S1_9HYPH|nr:carbohydrate ABC transporter permease [Labrys wisconsinensis]MDQ0468558.1 ABC-type glycerol-3-phosphate transport system permease component [Labrys wisconsinensis]